MLCCTLALVSGDGIDAGTYNVPAVMAGLGDTFTFQHAVVMLWVDSIIYALVAWYVEAVHPGEFGVAQPYYFPVTVRTWSVGLFSVYLLSRFENFNHTYE